MTEATTKIVTDFLKEDGWWVGGSTNFFHVALYQRTNSFKSKVQLKRNGMTFDAKSFLWISLLQPNDEVTIVADGPDEAEAVRQLKELMETKYLQDFDAKLKKFKEEEAKKAARRAERLKRLEQYTTTKKFLQNVDKVAFDQDELTDLIAGDVIQEIYLCANPFVIPLNRKNKTYVGIGKPVAIIQSNEPVDFDELGIKFKNVAFDGDYKKILRKKTPRAKKSVKATQTNTTKEVKPMAKKERFALIMEDGAEVRNIDDLKAHFDVGSVVRDFSSGKLLTWLEDRYYDEEADAIRAINDNDACLEAKLCEIFGVKTPEEIERRLQRLNRLKQFTNDEKILSKVDCVAFDQEDLADLLDEGVEEIYLCENRFVIPLRMKNKVYIGVGNAVAVIGNKKQKDFAALNIKFKNVAFDSDKKDSQTNSTPEIKSTAKNTQTTTKSKPFRFIDQLKVSNTSSTYAEATTTIENAVGIHARPASIMGQKACSFKSKIKIKAKGKTVDAKSILMIMSMGLTKGTEITICADGPDAQEAVKALKELVDSRFGEL